VPLVGRQPELVLVHRADGAAEQQLEHADPVGQRTVEYFLRVPFSGFIGAGKKGANI
jgi:hypothetical protein